MLCYLFLSAVHKLFMKDLRENKDYADIFKNSSLQQKYRGFEINQQIVYTMRSSVGHGYAGIQKLNTLMNIPKRVTVKTLTKKMIDAVNLVDIVCQY